MLWSWSDELETILKAPVVADFGLKQVLFDCRGAAELDPNMRLAEQFLRENSPKAALADGNAAAVHNLGSGRSGGDSYAHIEPSPDVPANRSNFVGGVLACHVTSRNSVYWESRSDSNLRR